MVKKFPPRETSFLVGFDIYLGFLAHIISASKQLLEKFFLDYLSTKYGSLDRYRQRLD